MFGKRNVWKRLTEKIFGRFKKKAFSENNGKYLGRKIESLEPASISLSTQGRDDQIPAVTLLAERKTNRGAELNDKEEAAFRASVGRLLRVARLTRPAVAFEAAASAQRCGESVASGQSCDRKKKKIPR